jgi:hypothetical protein
MKTKEEESLAETLAHIKTFLGESEPGTDITDGEVTIAFRYAEHRMWMQEMRAKVKTREAELAVQTENLRLMESWHAARLETERQRQLAAEAEKNYWEAKTAAVTLLQEASAPVKL